MLLKSFWLRSQAGRLLSVGGMAADFFHRWRHIHRCKRDAASRLSMRGGMVHLSRSSRATVWLSVEDLMMVAPNSPPVWAGHRGRRSGRALPLWGDNLCLWGIFDDWWTVIVKWFEADFNSKGWCDEFPNMTVKHLHYHIWRQTGDDGF